MIKLILFFAALTLSACSGGTLGGVSGGTPISNGPDARVVPMGTVLPFGEIAINCEVKSDQLGTKVDANGGFSLYDTAPTESRLRTHYLTGFKDNCARQFTAATALTGSAGTHEVVRYLPSNDAMPYSVVDEAYEAIKASYCRAGRGQPCGAKSHRLAEVISFVTAYQSFGENTTWTDILLYDGQVVAMGAEAP